MTRPRLACLLLLPALLGCSVIETPRSLRGHRIDPDLLGELVPGTSTKRDVTSLIGSPTTRATFNDNEWVYISETTHTRIGQMPGVLRQDVTVLTFDDTGVLRGVKRLNQDDARDVAMSGGATPSPGSDASFLQQLLGNVGRYNVGNIGGSSQDNTPGGGVGSSRGSSPP